MLTGALLLVFVLASLGGTSAAQSPTPKPSPPPRILATLTRTEGGFGQGAAYEVSIAMDGTVRYQGRANVGVLGVRTKKLTPRQLEELIAAFDEAGYFSLKDKYDQGPTDNTWTITSFSRGGRTKTVEHYMAADAPPALSELENGIDAIVGTREWVYLSPEEERRRQREQEARGRAEVDAMRAKMPRLRAQLRDPQPDVRRRAASELFAARGYTNANGSHLVGAIELAAMAPVIGEALTHPDAAVRKEAARQLIAFGPEATGLVPGLTAALSDPDASMRTEAAAKLRLIGRPAAVSAIPALERALQDLDPNVRYYAASALPELGYSRDRVIEVLLAGLRSADERVRLASASALTGQGPAGRVAVAALREALRDPSPRVREAALQALRYVDTAP